MITIGSQTELTQNLCNYIFELFRRIYFPVDV